MECRFHLHAADGRRVLSQRPGDLSIDHERLPVDASPALRDERLGVLGVLQEYGVRKRRGVRGRRAARVVLLAYLLMTLGYPGVKFVTDVLMA